MLRCMKRGAFAVLFAVVAVLAGCGPRGHSAGGAGATVGAQASVNAPLGAQDWLAAWSRVYLPDAKPREYEEAPVAPVAAAARVPSLFTVKTEAGPLSLTT